MDAKLRALIVAANAGEPCPPLHILTSSAAVSGVPSHHGSFAERLRAPISEELWHGYRGGRGGEAEATFNARLEELRPTWQLMSDAHDERDDAITLIDAEVWPLTGGDGLALAAVRVPTAAITAWWSGAGRRLKAPTQWSFGFGVITPIGDG